MLDKNVNYAEACRMSAILMAVNLLKGGSCVAFVKKISGLTWKELQSRHVVYKDAAGRFFSNVDVTKKENTNVKSNKQQKRENRKQFFERRNARKHHAADRKAQG